MLDLVPDTRKAELRTHLVFLGGHFEDEEPVIAAFKRWLEPDSFTIDLSVRDQVTFCSKPLDETAVAAVQRKFRALKARRNLGGQLLTAGRVKCGKHRI